MIFGFGGRGGGLGIRSVVFDGFPYTCINIMQGLITGRMLENQFPNPRLKDRLSLIWFYTNSPHSWKLEVGVFFHDKEIKAKIGLSHWSDVLEEYHTNVVFADLGKICSGVCRSWWHLLSLGVEVASVPATDSSLRLGLQERRFPQLQLRNLDKQC